MRFELSSLLNHPCPNIWHDLTAVGRLDGATLEVDDAIAQRILARCASPVEPVPIMASGANSVMEWPRWAKLMARQRRPGEIGVGDTLERMFARLGANTLTLIYERYAGKSCGCKNRKDWLNRRYGYR